jgi:aerobic C4-dicarboxylate transport protein
MSEVRSITNLIGNAVATVAVAHWDDALDLRQAREVLAGNQLAAIDTSNAAVWTEPERLT